MGIISIERVVALLEKEVRPAMGCTDRVILNLMCEKNEK